MTNNHGKQLNIDFRTGAATAINDDKVCENARSACCAINRERSKGIRTALEPDHQDGENSDDVSFRAKCQLNLVPLVRLAALGLERREDGELISSGGLKPLRPGAEAAPFLDASAGIVYKLFYFNKKGGSFFMGKRLAMPSAKDGYGFEIIDEDSDGFDVLEKISIMNEAGALMTEVVGLSDCFYYIVTKQPQAYPLGYISEFERISSGNHAKLARFDSDRKKAQDSMCAVGIIGGQGLNAHTVMIYVDDNYWLVGDLHEKNVMLDADGNPTIIDALIGLVTKPALSRHNWLRPNCVAALEFRETRKMPNRDPYKDINDDEL
ncbi:hypothetical protein OAB00_04105 [Akkermansiaceae bacterium]|nr:hypothetical protein [Akkermansiaceae bacterium]